MAHVWKKEERRNDNRDRGITLADRVRKLEKEKTLAERSRETRETAKSFKWPLRWSWKFRQTHRKINVEQILVIFLNKKNQIEVPKFMPIFDGNMVIWKNKPYEFDPRAVWRILGVKKFPQVYLIKEIDRRPVRNKFGRVVYRDAAVSNMDVDEVRRRGDSTESDEFLIKAALKAQTTAIKKNASMVLVILLILGVVGGIVWFISGGPAAP